MTARAGAYLPPFVSQKRKDSPPFDDCALESGLMLGALWTLGELTRKPEGDLRPLHDMSTRLRRRIDEPSGGLTLADVDDALHTIDPTLPRLPRYPGQNPPPAPRDTLRLTWAEYRAMLEDGHASILLGYQTDASTVGHAIVAFRGNDKGAIVMDPWENRPLSWNGERWSWQRLRAFTEREHAGNRFGAPTAIACAVVRIGDETEAERAKRAAATDLERLRGRIAAKDARIELVEGERDEARRMASEYATVSNDLRARIKELEATPVDCGPIQADNDRLTIELETAIRSQGEAERQRDEARQALADEQDRAIRAEDTVLAVKRAVGCV